MDRGGQPQSQRPGHAGTPESLDRYLESHVAGRGSARSAHRQKRQTRQRLAYRLWGQPWRGTVKGMLSDTPRQKLAAMIALDGIKVASDARLCEALLRDYCGEYRLEIAALTAAVKWGIPKSLQQPGLVPPATLRANLARRLQENHGLAEESAYWAVDAWTSVLQQLNDPAVPETASNLLDEHDSK